MNFENKNMDVLRRFEAECPAVFKPLAEYLKIFNIFDVLRCDTTEIRHSNVLAWLLDPQENHGLGRSFLLGWLTEVFQPEFREVLPSAKWAELNEAEIRKVEVLREWEHIDILIRIRLSSGHSRIICIENKVHAQQRNGQLSDYKTIVERHHPDPDQRDFIFLTKGTENPDNPTFVVAKYNQVAKVLEKCRQQSADCIAEGPQLLIDNYLYILNERFMDSSYEQKLAQEIYQKHRKALDLIFKHLPDAKQTLTNILVGRLSEDATTLGFTLLRPNKGLVRFIPREWDTSVNRENLPSDWRHVFCQIEILAKNPILIATICPHKLDVDQPTDLARSVDEAAQRFKFTKERNKSSLASEWYAFYSVHGLAINIDSIDEEDALDMANRIWQWVRRELQGEGFRAMTKAVAPLLVTHFDARA